MNKLILTAFLFAASAIGQVVNPGGGASYPGVASDGSNGLSVTGKVASSTANVSASDSPNLLVVKDPNLGSGNNGTIAAAVQPQNFYDLLSVHNAIANMQTGSGNNPAQLRMNNIGDSTAQFHNFASVCTMAAQFGTAGFDLNGIGGSQFGYGQPCGANPLGVSNNASTGTITQNNGSGSITPGVGAPYDFTRWVDGVVTNIAASSSITYGGGGGNARGTELRVEYITEPTDGIYGATPGTITVTATGVTNCSSGCVIGTINLSGSVAGGVLSVREPFDFWTIKIATNGVGAADIVGVGIFDNAHNGVIGIGGWGRSALAVPDMTTTPSAITQPISTAVSGAPLAITSYSITSNVITFNYPAGPQTLAAGDKIIGAGFLTSTFLDGVAFTVSSATATSFSAPFTYTNTSATEAGLGLLSDSNYISQVEFKDNGAFNPSTCQAATLANPTTYQPYGTWLATMLSEASFGNPNASVELTGSYSPYLGATCLPVFNDQERQYAQQNGAIYFDNWFPATVYQRFNLGQEGSQGVHSLASENLASSQRLVAQLGLMSNYLGYEGRPVASSLGALSKLYLGSGNPNTSAAGVNNPANAVGAVGDAAASELVPDASLNQNWYLSKQLNLYDYTGTNPIFCFGVSSSSGSFPANCKVTSNYLGQFFLNGTTSAQLNITPSSGSVNVAFTAAGTGGVQINMQSTANGQVNWIDYHLASTDEWGTGLYNQSATYLFYDRSTSHEPVRIPQGMPDDSMDGNSNGVALKTLNTITNCAVNSTSPAACGSAASGAVVVPTTTTTYTINTSAVTAASRIFLFPMSFASNLPSSPTCVVPAVTSAPTISAISAATSFTFTLPSTTGQTCWSYEIVN